MQYNKSSEDYLETILLLKEKLGEVRSIDIVNDTGYTKPSISVAMKKLREQDYILVDTKGFISLTQKGRDIAENIYTKHRYLKQFFLEIGVDEENATKDACKIEHEISDVSFQCIKNHLMELRNNEIF